MGLPHSAIVSLEKQKTVSCISVLIAVVDLEMLQGQDEDMEQLHHHHVVHKELFERHVSLSVIYEMSELCRWRSCIGVWVWYSAKGLLHAISCTC